MQDSAAVILERLSTGRYFRRPKMSPKMADIVLDELLSTICRRQERDEVAKIGSLDAERD